MHLNPKQLAAVASLATVAQKKNGDSRVIQSVRVEVENGTLVAVATDRYRAARLTFPVESPDFAPVVIDSAWLTDAAKTFKATGADITVTNELVTASHNGTVSGTTPRTGSYPPIERLFPSQSDANKVNEGLPAVTLNPVYVAGAGKLSHPDAPAPAGWRFRFTGTPERPGPVVLDLPGVKPENGSIEYIIQPARA